MSEEKKCPSKVYAPNDSNKVSSYQNKLKEFEIPDPYTLHDSVWMMGSCSMSFTPDIDIDNIYCYLVLTRDDVTREAFKAYKSLQSFKQVSDGYVGSFGVFKVNDHVVLMKAKVSHSQSLNLPPANPWVASKTDGFLLTGHCDCVAGLGESCSHVGAVLFAAQTQAKMNRDMSCTQIKCSWLDSYTKPAPLKRLTELHQLQRTPKEVEGIPFPTPSEMDHYLSDLKKETRCVLLSSYHGHIDDYVPAKRRLDLPHPLSELYNNNFAGRPLSVLLEEGRRLLPSLNVTLHQAEALERATKDQHSNTLWMEQRVGLITASNAKKIANMNLTNPPNSFIQQLCHGQKKFAREPDQLRYGREHEAVAAKDFSKALQQKGLHPGFVMEMSGLHLSTELRFIGASPDRKFSCPCCGKGLVEIKCPYTHRETGVEAAALTDKLFCLHMCKDTGKLLLNTSHDYYYQIQLQMHVTKTIFCFFVVWTSVDMHVQLVDYDPVFCSTLVDKLTAAFHLVILPELIGEFFTKTRHTDGLKDPSDLLLCYCRKRKEGKRVWCSSGKENCAIWEFHEACVMEKDSLRRVTNRWKCIGCKDGTKKEKQKKEKLLKAAGKAAVTAVAAASAAGLPIPPTGPSGCKGSPPAISRALKPKN